MKKEYKTPTAEKVVFDYAESVVACPSGCVDPTHSWHQGYCYNVCNGFGNNNGNGNGSNDGNQGTKPTNPPGEQTNQYYAPGWGLNC